MIAKSSKGVLANIKLNERSGIFGLVCRRPTWYEIFFDPIQRQKKRRDYLMKNYKFINDRHKNYKSLGLDIKPSGFRDLSSQNLEGHSNSLKCPFCKKTEPCPHCPE